MHAIISDYISVVKINKIKTAMLPLQAASLCIFIPWNTISLFQRTLGSRTIGQSFYFFWTITPLRPRNFSSLLLRTCPKSFYILPRGLVKSCSVPSLSHVVVFFHEKYPPDDVPLWEVICANMKELLITAKARNYYFLLLLFTQWNTVPPPVFWIFYR